MAGKRYQPFIGLEVHIQLNTKTKMFCGCRAEVFGAEPNRHTCPVCLGLPGALPVPNRVALEKTLRLALALGCSINRGTFFERKNYFYPDLPKGYQITQYQKPLGKGGQLKFGLGRKVERVRIRRVHLEEDTGTLKHEGNRTLVNFNRSGVPLVEIVTEPDLHSAEETELFLRELHQLVRWLGVSDADMEKGSMRLEPSVSVSREGLLPEWRVELKNINSFHYAKRAVELEIERLTRLLESGQEPRQETRGYDEERDVTFVQRIKEEEADYRYFPEPDIPPLHLTQEQVVTIAQKLPPLPHQIRQSLAANFKSLDEEKVRLLTRERKVYDYFSRLVELGLDPQRAANLIINRPEKMSLDPEELVRLLQKEEAETIDSAKDLKSIVEEVVRKNPKPVADYRAGDLNAINFLIGQVMKETDGKAKAQVVRELLLKIL